MDPANAVDTAAKVAKSLSPTEGFFGAALAVVTGGVSLIAGATIDATSSAVKTSMEGAKALTQDMFGLDPQQRYDKFQHDVMPGLATGFVDKLEMWALLISGDEVKLNGTDFTLVSSYEPGKPLLVSMRGRVTNALSRSDVSAVVVKSMTALPTGCRVVLNSATLRYQTRGFRHDLVSDSRVNDDIGVPTVVFSGEGLPDPVTGLLPSLPSLLRPLPPGFPAGFIPSPGMTPVSGGDGATLYTPLDEWEQRAPRLEDVRLSAELVEHLNANLEFYHHAIWWTMDPNRRYMLLDGFEAPNSQGRSVASVVDNSLIGIVGNALVMPVAPGNHLDPLFGLADGATLLEQYDPQSPAPPSRISLPTPGVFAEAVLGECNACEEIDDTRFWRWDEVPIDEPPALDLSMLASRRSEPGSVSPTAFPTPIIGTQTPPTLPDPAGIGPILEALGRQSFPDITGLTGTQANAAAALAKAMDTALAYGQEASKLAQAASAQRNIGQTMRQIDKADSDNKIDPEKAKQLRTEALTNLVGTKPTPERSDQIAGSHLLDQIDPSQVEYAKVGEGATEVKLVGHTAPIHARGVSNIGNRNGEGSAVYEQLLEGGSKLLESIAEGIADWKEAPSKELGDAVVESITTSLQEAAVDKVTDLLPMVKVFKVVGQLSVAFADGVGREIERINAENAEKYGRAYTDGSGPDGYTDVDSLQYVRRFQANNVANLQQVLVGGLIDTVEAAVGMGFSWMKGAALGAIGSVTKQLLTEYISSSSFAALAADAFTTISEAVPAKRLNIYRVVLNTVIGLYVRQLGEKSVRDALKGLTKLGNKKPVEKELAAALASLLVDPVMKAADDWLKKRVTSRLKDLFNDLRDSNQTITAGKIAADDNGITLPQSVITLVDDGPDAAQADKDSQYAYYLDNMQPVTDNVRRLSVAIGKARQRGLVTAFDSADSEARTPIWNRYIDELRQLGAEWLKASDSLIEQLDEPAATEAKTSAGTGAPMRMLKADDPSRWEAVHYKYSRLSNGYILQPDTTTL